MEQCTEKIRYMNIEYMVEVVFKTEFFVSIMEFLVSGIGPINQKFHIFFFFFSRRMRFIYKSGKDNSVSLKLVEFRFKVKNSS